MSFTQTARLDLSPPARTIRVHTMSRHSDYVLRNHCIQHLNLIESLRMVICGLLSLAIQVRCSVELDIDAQWWSRIACVGAVHLGFSSRETIRPGLLTSQSHVGKTVPREFLEGRRRIDAPRIRSPYGPKAARPTTV